ncbi:MAG: Stp1/IreP family PP2C-type Ser/Thr phosphatase [Rhodocyclaceae bacterium]|nr:Stp1/IreP family PP2C-type Ser/Thr phosphatase [Rhodocyclaceae bacterium]MDZ4216670.1 Stp1/IreP family PP2C-type Ser/Thr phosphatase [Rhodocyclaceae bacterium]
MAKIDLSIAIEMATCSDPGRVRTNNEDSVLANPQLGLAVLADGMGGYNAGEVASSMATAVLGSELEHAFGVHPPHQISEDGKTWAHAALIDRVTKTNAAIHHAASSNAQYAGMGTTLVIVQFFDNRMAVAHIGDSRLYRLRNGELSRVTRDHSLLQEQLDSGLITPEQARFSQNKNLVTRAMGVDTHVDTELAEHAVLPGDVYLLCSDGLNDMVEDDEIALTLSSLSANLPLCAQQLVDMANDNGGRDNVSVILAKIKQPFPAPEMTSGWKERVQSWFS